MQVARGQARVAPHDLRMLKAASAEVYLPERPESADPDWNERRASTRVRAVALRAALEIGAFDLQFQPIVRLDDGVPHHHEALLRPQPILALGSLSPQEFVNFAESVGLAPELDLAVFARVLEAAGRAPAITIAANISGQSLQSAAFCRRLCALRDASGIAAERLLIELTETAEIDDTRTARASLDAMRETGIRVCLDDLGAGAAAFRYLRDFPVDLVKIDGSYVRAAAREDRDRRLVAAMVALAHALGAGVIAERVETAAEAAAMRELGVDYGQGWLFGRPGKLPAPAVTGAG